MSREYGNANLFLVDCSNPIFTLDCLITNISDESCDEAYMTQKDPGHCVIVYVVLVAWVEVPGPTIKSSFMV